jgi:DNA gyrase/topoisomerase IV subunit A
MVITISHTGYIKRIPVTTYRKQRRGGRGLNAMDTKEDDWVEHLFIASTHDYLMFFTDRGQVYWLKVHEIPQGGPRRAGQAGRALHQHPARASGSRHWSRCAPSTTSTGSCSPPATAR